MKLALLFVTFLVAKLEGVSVSDLVQEEWNEFKVTYQKKYSNPTEERFRMKIYMENAHKIAKHNQKYEMGLVPYKLGINKFADMLHYEFVRTYNGYKKSLKPAKNDPYKPATFISPANVKLPDEVDWRTQGAVTPIKDQGDCGSCWSFSATGSLEGQHFRKYGKLVSLSEQNLVDCSESYGNMGCSGGLMDYAYAYIRDQRGLDTESSYPYEAIDDECRYNPATSGADDTGYTDIEAGSEDKLKEAVATIGPISVAIDASSADFQLYKEGVYYEPDCSTELLDHAVLVVGYGTTDEGEDYWLVKNSWGVSWGDSGYIKMSRNRNNNCGIASKASYPLV